MPGRDRTIAIVDDCEADLAAERRTEMQVYDLLDRIAADDHARPTLVRVGQQVLNHLLTAAARNPVPGV